MGNKLMDSIKGKPISLLKRAALHQSVLLKSKYSDEILEDSIPVLWFGEPAPRNWVTIATNPSTREFLDSDDQVLHGDNARFFIRDKGVKLEDYAFDEAQLGDTIESYKSYFKRDTAYKNWFGKPNGAKLEAF
jgi:hypothetical protein